MKNLFIPLLLICFFFSFSSCSSQNLDEVEDTVTFAQLPVEAQNFLNRYFQGKSNYLKGQDMEVENITLYKVETVDGYQITFNSSGYWQEVYAPTGKTIPTGFIPEPIIATLDYQYHGYGIVAINTQGENYHVVLSNNQGGDSVDLIFNQSGEIIP